MSRVGTLACARDDTADPLDAGTVVGLQGGGNVATGIIDSFGVNSFVVGSVSW